MPRKYPWPATKIDRDLIHELHLESVKSGRPITALIAEAVESYLNPKLNAPVVGVAKATVRVAA